jgi:hypothetical protein
MNETLTPEQTQALLAATPKYVKAGLTPPWAGEDAWVYLRQEAVFYGGGKISVGYYCPPAVAAAVIAWAGEVMSWALDKWKKDEGPYADLDYDQAVGKWYVMIGGPDMYHEWFESQLAASVALIEAVAEGLGEG